MPGIAKGNANAASARHKDWSSSSQPCQGRAGWELPDTFESAVLLRLSYHLFGGTHVTADLGLVNREHDQLVEPPVTPSVKLQGLKHGAIFFLDDTEELVS